MTKEEYLKLKEKVNELQKKRLEVIKIEDEIEKLKETEEVKRYLQLISIYKDKTTGRNSGFDRFTDKNLISIALGEINITPSDEIYVYMGTYKNSVETDIIHGSSDIPINRLSPDADYVIYKNLESKYNDSIIILYKDVDEFEQTHKIIIPKSAANRGGYFYELQMEYFQTMILESQEAATEKVNKLVKKRI
mgnify:FL=1